MEPVNVTADLPQQKVGDTITNITPNDNRKDSDVAITTLTDAAGKPVATATVPSQEQNVSVEKPPSPVPDTSVGAAPLRSAFADAPSPVPETDTFGDAGEQSDSISAGDREYALMGHRTTVQLHQMPSSDASRQHHLLRHSLPSEQRGHNVLSHFGVETIAEASKLIKKMSQRDLQAKFKAVYGARTFSNNNNWLRRKLFEAIGLDPSKGAVKKPGASTQRRRRPAKASPKTTGPRFARRPRGDLMDDNRHVAEALLALGELAGLVAEGYDLDQLETQATVDPEAEGLSDGRVPTSSFDEGTAADGRSRWTQQATRGVPRSETASPELEQRGAPTPGITGPASPEVVVDPGVRHPAAIPGGGVVAGIVAHEQATTQGEAMHASMAAMFEWMARMQRQAMEHAAMSGHMVAAGSHATVPAGMQQTGAMSPQLALMQMQMAAMAGNPAAAQMLQAIAMAQAAAANGASVPEAYQRMMIEAAQQQQQQHSMEMMERMMSGVVAGQQAAQQAIQGGAEPAPVAAQAL